MFLHGRGRFHYLADALSSALCAAVMAVQLMLDPYITSAVKTGRGNDITYSVSANNTVRQMLSSATTRIAEAILLNSSRHLFTCAADLILRVDMVYTIRISRSRAGRAASFS